MLRQTLSKGRKLGLQPTYKAFLLKTSLIKFRDLFLPLREIWFPFCSSDVCTELIRLKRVRLVCLLALDFVFFSGFATFAFAKPHTRILKLDKAGLRLNHHTWWTFLSTTFLLSLIYLNSVDIILIKWFASNNISNKNCKLLF